MAPELGTLRADGIAPAIDFMPLATMVADMSGAVLAVNPAWTQMSGLSEPDSLRSGWLDLIPGPEQPRLLRTLNRVLEGGGLETLEQEIEGRDGTRWTRWTFRRHDHSGGRVVVMVVVDLDAEHNLQVDLRHRATHDALTGLINRAEFLELTARAMGRQDGRAGIVYVDLDRFKEVNDEGGHQLGDRVLAAVAQRLRAGVRPADIVGRVGGDEFAVLCHDLCDRASLEEVADRLRAGLEAPLDVDGRVRRIGATTGVAVSAPGANPEDVLDAADRAMYAAKSRRRKAPRTAVVRAGGSSRTQDHGQGRLPAPPEHCSGEARELLQHLYNARLSLHSCARSASTASVDEPWAAIDEVDAVLAYLRPGTRLPDRPRDRGEAS